MKIKVILSIILMVLLAYQVSSAQIYGGFGGGYIQPFSDFEAINKSTNSYLLNLENRHYCKLWYGVRFEYSEFDPVDNLDPIIPHYQNILNITPNVRYNFLGINCYDNVVFPYLQLGLVFSSASSTDNSSKLGIGAVGGGGVSYGFNLFKTCFILDANAAYNVPNIILKDDVRTEIQYLHINLTLNMKL